MLFKPAQLLFHNVNWAFCKRLWVNFVACRCSSPPNKNFGKLAESAGGENPSSSAFYNV